MSATAMALFDLIRGGDIGEVRALLEVEPELANVRDQQGLTPTITAHYYGRPSLAALLVEHGAMLDIFDAAAHGDAARIAALLEYDSSLPASYSADGWTPLALAAFFGREEVARLLLVAGADPLARSRNGLRNQPLHAAAAGRHPALVRLLLAHGADATATQAGDYTPLHAAAQNGDADSLRALLAAGADANAVSAQGKTAADLALEQGHTEILSLLAAGR